MIPADAHDNTSGQELMFEAADTQSEISLTDEAAAAQPNVRVHMRGETISEVTTAAYPVILPITEVKLFINEQTGGMEEIVLVGPDGGYHVRDNKVGVCIQYSDGAGNMEPDIRYLVLKPPFRAGYARP